MRIETTSNPSGKNWKDYKAENAEIKRASQINNDIYSLLLKAKYGNCSAIKKLLEYTLPDFADFANAEFAIKLWEEGQKMLDKASDIYTDGAGKLSDLSKKAAEHSVFENAKGNLTEAEGQREVNAIVDDLECSINYRRSNS